MELGPYTVGPRIAQGRRAEVWRARSLWGQDVAIKVLARDAADRHDATDALVFDLNRRMRLVHPGIAQVLDHGVVPAGPHELSVGSPWFALAYVPAGTLEDLEALAESNVIRLGWLLLDALAYAHARGVVHRDVKASNVLNVVCTQGLRWPCLTDFGTRHGEGTRGYAAPEQRRRVGQVSAGTDLYAVGCLLVRLLEGHLPEQPRDWLRSKQAGRLGLDPAFRVWLERMLEPEAADRFPTAAHAAWWLSRHHDGLPQGPCWSWDVAGQSDELRLPMNSVRRGWPNVPVEEPRRGAGFALTGGGVFVGRKPLIARSWKLLQRAASGEGPTACVIQGAEGMGKSRFTEWVGQRLREVGQVGVIHVQALKGEEASGTLRKLETQMGSVEQGAFGPPPADPAWTEPHGPRRTRGTGRDDVSGRYRALLRWVERFATTQPLVVIVDDVQHCPKFLEGLGALMGGQAKHLSVLTSWRVGEHAFSGSLSAIRDRFLESPGVSLEPLSPLSSAEAHQLLSGLLFLKKSDLAKRVEEGDGHPGRLVGSLRECIVGQRLKPSAEGYTTPS